ncbi:helix-turn-helix transcriptional regulator [uncultured Oscillibacter sp.]|uniref:helix-turn-helix domain-containing protein n=1 Tax=uncultured Oscillibacter sp. TaxID=876091 RepID=UPI0025E74D25|nr:helix-turn-helix transcriptional regulator [uncultured Oscillibacter sp.]
MNVSNQIRHLCAALNISIAELARRLGTSPQNLNAKLRRKSFTIDDLERIAVATETLFDWKFILPNGKTINKE